MCRCQKMIFNTSFIVFLTLTVYGVSCAKDEVEITGEKEIREGKEYRLEAWRAVENERLSMSGWIPQETTSEKQQPPTSKRRRLRKRKRRPAQSNETAKIQDRLLYVPNRRQRPFKFGENEEVWDDMEQESPKQAVSRRRVVPSFAPDSSEEEPEILTGRPSGNPLSAVIRFGDASVEETTKMRATEKIRDPFDALKEAEEKQKTPEEIKQTIPPPNLKALLKKTGGTISLSEILQQKNLSLSQLLKGNVEAISALTSPPDVTEPTEMMEFSEQTKYERIPPSERKKLLDRVSIQSSEKDEMEEKEIMEAQRKRLALLQAHKENKVYLGITQSYNMVTEPVTERRIFVPSHPKHYSTTSYKPLLFQTIPKSPTKNKILSEHPKENETQESSNTIKTIKYPYKKLPITSAKLLTKTTEKAIIPNLPPKAVPISLEEILQKQRPSVEENNDEPLQISLNFDIPSKSEDSDESSEMEVETSNEKLKTLGAGEEIMEMLENPVYKDKLSRILHERNMTLQELLDQRERGSSQLHLADIFHNKTREPEPIEEPYVGLIIKNDYSNHLRQQKSMDYAEKQIIKSKTPDIKVTTPENIILSSTEKKLMPIQALPPNNSFNYAAIMPFWKQFHPNLFNNLYKEDVGSLNDIERIEEVDNRLSDSINHQFNVDLNQRNYHLDEESIFDIPTGIKSALIASFAIVAFSLLMFLTILLIFKWTQRRKNKMNYTGSLSGIKIKAPILDVPRKSALRTFVCETLGRRTKFYNTNLQSMSDIWDEKKQKF